MKNFIIITMLLSSLMLLGQCSNMNINQYNQLKFNDNLVSLIRDTNGDHSAVTSVFNESFIVNSEQEPLNWIEYISPSVELFFDDGHENDSTGQIEYQLTILKIKSSMYDVKFNGITINVGDNVSILGSDPPIITYTDFRRSVCYKIGSESLAFYLSPNNTITSIQYQYFN